MHLLRMRLSGLGPFGEIDLGFADDDGDPRLVTVVHGGGGVGKTTLLTALACTRPGNAIVSSALGGERDTPGAAVCEFHLGQDDPERPHALVVASPNVRVHDSDETEVLRRREQALFDRVAREAGFAFVAISSNRFFSRQPIALIAPGRGVARYDVRAPVGGEDPARADLGRETKQALAYAAITGALADSNPARRRFEWLQSSMTRAVNELAGLAGYSFCGVDLLTLEPQFTDHNGQPRSFDALPTRARHLVAFVALPVRALWAAYPFREPLEAEGIVTIDEVDLYQDPAVLTHLVPALKKALPRVQWILAATSPLVAASCDASEVIALRRSPERGVVEHFTGPLALTH
jgi:hypothetical protein